MCFVAPVHTTISVENSNYSVISRKLMNIKKDIAYVSNHIQNVANQAKPDIL